MAASPACLQYEKERIAVQAAIAQFFCMKQRKGRPGSALSLSDASSGGPNYKQRTDRAQLIILLMQAEIDKEQERCDPFAIIHNARSSKASRSRKSSISVVDKDRPRTKTKKLRKMTLNPQSIRYEEIKEIEEHHQEKTAAHSERGDMKEQSQINIDDFLDLGWPKKMQSQKEIELQSGIFVGIGSQRELDTDFNWGKPTRMDLEFQMKE